MSEPREERIAHARRWLALAEGDLDSARLLVSHGALALRNAAFHAQQTGEKSLKAMLVANGLPVPRTHSLSRLVDLLPVAPQGLSSAELHPLEPWAVEGRYAEEGGALTPEEADVLVALAARVLAACQHLLSALEHPNVGSNASTSPASEPPSTDE